MSLGVREYARHRKASGLAGGTHKAVQAAISSGRLSTSLTRDRKRIRSAELADREWSGTTRADRIPLTGRTSTGAQPPDLQESRARREAALAELAEIEVAEKRAELVPVEEVRTHMIHMFTVVKTKLLAVPSRLRQRDNSFTSPQIGMIDDLIREALTELADDGGSSGTDDSEEV